MKTTISEYDFTQAFVNMNRETNFSYAGRKALFAYFEDYEQDTGEEIELDVVAICCEYTEYASIEEFIGEYDDSYIVWDVEPEDATPCYVAGWNMPGYMPDSEPEEFDDLDDARGYIMDTLESMADDIEDDADADDLKKRDEYINARGAMLLNNKPNSEPEAGFYAGNYFFFISLGDSTEAVEGEIDYEATLDKIRDYTQVIDIDGESFIISDF